MTSINVDVEMTPMTKLWRREGLVLSPPDGHAWWRSHAQTPTVLRLHDRLWRVFFGARTDGPRSHILYADLDPVDDFRVLDVSQEPVLEAGRHGAFDADGMGPATALAVGDRIYLYYTGIVRRADVPYQLAIGLAVSDDGGRCFHKATEGPLLAAGPYDPYFMSTPCVCHTPDGFEMWYASCVGWQDVNGLLEPFYALRHTRSDDGIIWSLATQMAVGFGDEADAGLTRAWVSQGPGGRDLWYCSRGADGFREPGEAAYRLRRVSLDATGVSVGGRDTVAFENPPVAGDWDEWMQAYPCVEPHGDDLIMLYNGNGFGHGGFGRARLAGGASRLRQEAGLATGRPEIT